MKEDDRQKAKEILRKRDLAKKGLLEKPEDGGDPLEEQEERTEDRAEKALVGSLAIKRSG